MCVRGRTLVAGAWRPGLLAARCRTRQRVREMGVPSATYVVAERCLWLQCAVELRGRHAVRRRATRSHHLYRSPVPLLSVRNHASHPIKCHACAVMKMSHPPCRRAAFAVWQLGPPRVDLLYQAVASGPVAVAIIPLQLVAHLYASQRIHL